MPESDPRPIPPTGASGPPPAAGRPVEPAENGTPAEPPRVISEPARPAPEGTPQAFNPGSIEASVVALAASVEGLAVEVAQARKRAAKVERQLIMLCGIATLIWWRVNNPKIPSLKGTVDNGPSSTVSE